MSRYKSDGSVVPAGIPVSQRRAQGGNRSLFSLKKGRVVDVVYPDDPRNLSGRRVEYVIYVDGQHYPNAVDVRTHGAIYDYSEKIRKKTEKSFEGKQDVSVLSENCDGEMVYVLFLNGNGDIPIIIGSAEHPKHATYKRISKGDGKFQVDEFNGVEIKIDKDSNYTITQAGRKDVNGTALNPAAVGATIKMAGNGDILFDSYGTLSDLHISLTKSSKQVKIFAQNNEIKLDSAGIDLKDKNGNEVKMLANDIKIKTSQKVSIGDGSNELLAILDAVITALGTVTVLTPVGPAAPMSGAPQWSAVTTQQTKLGNIKE